MGEVNGVASSAVDAEVAVAAVTAEAGAAGGSSAVDESDLRASRTAKGTVAVRAEDAAEEAVEERVAAAVDADTREDTCCPDGEEKEERGAPAPSKLKGGRRGGRCPSSSS